MKHVHENPHRKCPRCTIRYPSDVKVCPQCNVRTIKVLRVIRLARR